MNSTRGVRSLVILHLSVSLVLLLPETVLVFLSVQLPLHLLRDELFVVLETLLDVYLELDHVVQDSLDLGVQFLADSIGTVFKALVSADDVSTRSGLRMAGWN